MQGGQGTPFTLPPYLEAHGLIHTATLTPVNVTYSNPYLHPKLTPRSLGPPTVQGLTAPWINNDGTQAPLRGICELSQLSDGVPGSAH